MQNSINSRVALAILAGSSLAAAEPAAAATNFNSSAGLSYSIESIANLTNPGDLSGLEIVGYFRQINAPAYPGDEYSQVQINGTGSVAANNPDLATGSAFNYTFAASGTLANGTLDAHYLVGTAWNFAITAATVTRSACAWITCSARPSARRPIPARSLSISLTATGFCGKVTTVDTAFNDLDVVLAGSSGPFGFELAAGQMDGLYADVRMDNHLEASPVPLRPQSGRSWPA
ncbi:hypothetical protein [Methylomonas koyamae]|uniref:hypothetical protein n=1 Tax=Methylomonas koyamae TaxID=702114 RepID=UPI0006D1DFCB|nr:hypothetical protein [Methylomonas koyamae]